MHRSLLAFLLILCVAGRCLVDGARAAEAASPRHPYEVTAITAAGQVVQGILDERTHDAALWLRYEDDGLVLIQPLAWHEIVELRHGPSPLERAALREDYAQYATPAPRGLLASGPAEPLLLGEIVPPGAPLASVGSTPPSPAVRARIESIEIVGVRLLYADSQPGPDGWELLIAVHAQAGGPFAVRGTLQAEAWGERCSEIVDRGGWESLGRWSQAVDEHPLDDGVLVMTLRWRKPPERRRGELMPTARLQVRLAARGHGAFAADASVPVREFDETLDRLQLQDYRRVPGGRPAS
jgi:hypothetical protein